MKKLLAIFAVASLLITQTAYAALFPIGVGGTNNGSFSGNSLVSSNAAGTALVSTSTSPLTVGSIVATTTATSTFTGGVSTVGLRTSNGLTITGGNLLLTSGATSTANNGLNLTGGCFAVNNTCISSGSSGITAIGPTGQTQTGPTVTLATSTFSFLSLTSALTITGSGNTLTFLPSLSGSIGNTNTILFTTTTNNLSSITTANSSILITNSGGTPSWGTTLPAFTLGGAVTGSSQAITGLSQLTVTGTTASSTFSGGVQVGLTNGYFGIGTSTPWAALSLQALTGNTGLIIAVATTSNPTMGPALVMNSNGLIGVATSTPATVIDVRGTIYSEAGTTTPASSFAIDWAKVGNSTQIIMNGNITTLTFLNVKPGMGLRLNLCQGSGGSYTITNYDSSIYWSGGKPTLSTAIGKCDQENFSAWQGTSTPYITGGFITSP